MDVGREAACDHGHSEGMACAAAAGHAHAQVTKPANLHFTETGCPDDDKTSAVDCGSDCLPIWFGINDRPAELNHCARRKVSRLQPPPSHDMEYGFLRRNKVVGDDAAVTSPPYGFRTHYHAASLSPYVDQMVKASTKSVRKRVIGVIVKTLVRPETVDIPGQSSGFSAKAAKRGDVFI